MAIDWDAEVLSPVMSVFGEGKPGDPASLPLYTPRRLQPFRLADAVFDSEYQQVDVNPSDGTTSTNHLPVLGVRLALFPERPPVQNDSVYIPARGKTYLVTDVQPDGHGWALLRLMETA